MILELLGWWYGAGWKQAIGRTIGWTREVLRLFSVGTLVRTLFAPWRRIVNVGARSFDQKMHAALDNLVSRCVGLTVRLSVLIAAAVLAAVTFLIAALLAVAWPLLPVLSVYCLVRGLTG